jgi:SAM-dependent methyltransferase
MATESWQLQVFKRSLKKKEKLKLLERNLQAAPQSLNLDLGCAQGTLSYFLRRKGGCWLSADMDFINLRATQGLVNRNLVQLEEGPLPFKDRSFDMVACLDYLEHLEKDDFCLEEIFRVLKTRGCLVLATPRTGKLFVLHKLRSLIGLKLELYGHKREGYSLETIQKKLKKAGFLVGFHKNFSRFFTEFLELILNFLYIKFFPAEAPSNLRDGRIRPTNAEEFRNKKKTFRLYSILYPMIWAVSRIDKALFFLKGYGLMIWAQRPKDN